MGFSYSDYHLLIDCLRDNNYIFSSYHDWNKKDKCVILRHDIDNDLQKALTLAQFESEKCVDVKSTYFILLTSDFYNVFSKKSLETIKKIYAYGHDIGLHFDETRYPEAIGNTTAIKDAILKESRILSEAIDYPISVVSMHRPSKAILEADLEIPGIINSYGKKYFCEFKYLSDSRRRWREPVLDVVKNGKFDKLHILTHAFWYENTEETINQTVKKFVNRGSWERYSYMRGNITDLESIMGENEVLTL